MYVYFVVARNLLVFVKKVSPTLHRFADLRAVLVRGYHRLPSLPAAIKTIYCRFSCINFLFEGFN